MNISQICQIWLNNRSPRTIHNYTLAVERADRVARALYRKGFEELSHVELVGLMQYESARQSKRSQSTLTYVFRSFFKTVQRLGIRKDNPAEDLRAPKFADTLADRIIDHSEVEAVMRAAASLRDRLMFKVMYLAGARVGELVELKCRDLLVKQQKGATTFTLRFWGKGQVTGYVRLPDEFGQELQEFIRSCNPNDFMFSHSQGRKFSSAGVRGMLKFASRKAGIRKVTPHFFRHAAATQMLDNGASLVQVQRFLRHKSIQTTTHYLHLNPDEPGSSFIPKINE